MRCLGGTVYTFLASLCVCCGKAKLRIIIWHVYMYVCVRAGVLAGYPDESFHFTLFPTRPDKLLSSDQVESSKIRNDGSIRVLFTAGQSNSTCGNRNANTSEAAGDSSHLSPNCLLEANAGR